MRFIAITFATVVVLLSSGCDDDELVGGAPAVLPAALVLVGGDGQTAEPGHWLRATLQVRVTDHTGRPLHRVPVTWVGLSGGGTLRPASSVSDQDGVAKTNWLLGKDAGENTAIAVVGELPFVTFTANGVWACEPYCGSWSVANPMPTAREGLAAAVVGGKIYTIGGDATFDWCSPGKSVVEIYDPASDSWSAGSAMPTPRNLLAAASVGGRIYAFGGCGGRSRGPGSLAANEEYDPVTNHWTSKTQMPTPRAGAAVGVIGDLIYVVGGGVPWPIDVTTVVEVYDPATDSWSARPSLQTPRMFAAAAVVDEKLFVMGGSVGNSRESVVEMYDPDAYQWVYRARMPRSSGPLSAVVLDGRIYVTASYGDPLAMEVYDPDTDTWTRSSPPRFERFDATAAVVGQRIYLIGGVSDTTFYRPLDSIEVFTPRATSTSRRPW
ncbi:MAG: hypothetical protein L0271_10265 [Gemmatimonadetes bacterium]|nr:hypothetical protein [Gemmatimonadota bacterium]